MSALPAKMPRMRGVHPEYVDGMAGPSSPGPSRTGRGGRGRRASGLDDATLAESALDYSVDDFEVNELVLARNPLRQDAWWPVRIAHTLFHFSKRNPGPPIATLGPPRKLEHRLRALLSNF